MNTNLLLESSKNTFFVKAGFLITLEAQGIIGATYTTMNWTCHMNYIKIYSEQYVKNTSMLPDKRIATVPALPTKIM